MARAVYVCAIGCTTDCTHGHACMVYASDEEHPHPTERGRAHHFAYDFERNEMHEWNGERGKCRIYTPEEQ